jgi:hypothetical protein
MNELKQGYEYIRNLYETTHIIQLGSLVSLCDRRFGSKAQVTDRIAYELCEVCKNEYEKQTNEQKQYAVGKG